MNPFLEEMTQGDLAETMIRIAVNFCPKLKDIQQQLEDMQKEFTLLSIFPVAKIGENQVVAPCRLNRERSGRTDDVSAGRQSEVERGFVGSCT
jgi:hypothetical protein